MFWKKEDTGGFDYEKSNTVAGDDVITQGMKEDLGSAVDAYIKKARIKRDDREMLREFVQQNLAQEATVEALDRRIVAFARGYKEDTAKIGLNARGQLNPELTPEEFQELREKTDIEFERMEYTESERRLLNQRRKNILARLVKALPKPDHAAAAEVIRVVDYKISGIDSVIDQSASDISMESEERFAEDMEMFKQLNQGGLENLLDDDDDEEEFYEGELDGGLPETEEELPEVEEALPDTEEEHVDSFGAEEEGEAFPELFTDKHATLTIEEALADDEGYTDNDVSLLEELVENVEAELTDDTEGAADEEIDSVLEDEEIVLEDLIEEPYADELSAEDAVAEGEDAILEDAEELSKNTDGEGTDFEIEDPQPIDLDELSEDAETSVEEGADSDNGAAAAAELNEVDEAFKKLEAYRILLGEEAALAYAKSFNEPVHLAIYEELAEKYGWKETQV